MPLRAPLAFDLDLELFEGPFDLLLALVLREEIELAEVPLAEICVAYLELLAEDAELDLEAASEFLILVASLCEIKSRLLLPMEADELLQEPGEAAEELAARLAEYARIRAAAGWLRRRSDEVGRRVFRVGPAALRPPRPAERELPRERPERLAAALARLLEAPATVDVSHLPRRILPVRAFLARFRELLAERGSFSFDEAVAGLDRMAQAVAFWALLELYKRGEVDVVQAEPFAPIEIARAAPGGLVRSGAVA